MANEEIKRKFAVIRSGSFYSEKANRLLGNAKALDGLRVDLGCGEKPEAGFIGYDKRANQTKTGVFPIDLETLPYPLNTESCSIIIVSHILEHITPQKTIDVMNELWRLLKVGGALVVSTPYAGSVSYWQDPTHCNPFNEVTFTYFDPRFNMYRFYKPSPWFIKHIEWSEEENIDAILIKMAISGEENGGLALPINKKGDLNG